MVVQVLIKRKFVKHKAEELAPLIVRLRSLATMQPGYISGETLKCIDPPNEDEYLVRSTWESLEAWQNWYRSEQRTAIQSQIDAILKQETQYRVYESLIGGIMQHSR